MLLGFFEAPRPIRSNQRIRFGGVHIDLDEGDWVHPAPKSVFRIALGVLRGLGGEHFEPEFEDLQSWNLDALLCRFLESATFPTADVPFSDRPVNRILG